MDELRTALELATEDELQDLTEILFRRKFNPLDYLQGLDPLHVQNRDRIQWLNTLEDRFRFLAADGFTGRSQSRHVPSGLSEGLSLFETKIFAVSIND
jgi:hypothetical protein